MNDFTSLNGYNVKDKTIRDEIYNPPILILNDIDNLVTLCETIVNNKNKDCRGSIGSLEDTNLRTLLGNPNLGNYVVAKFYLILGDNEQGTIKIETNTYFGSLNAIGYINYQTLENTTSAQWSGWIKQTSLKGGLLAVGGVVTTSEGSYIQSLASTPFSSANVGTKSFDINGFIDGIIEVENNKIKINTLGLVKYVKVFVSISGVSSLYCQGLWFLKQDDLPTGVKDLTGNYNNLSIISVDEDTYGGGSFNYSYLVTSNDNLSFYIDPVFEPYGVLNQNSGFTPSSSGTRCTMTVEVYGKFI